MKYCPIGYCCFCMAINTFKSSLIFTTNIEEPDWAEFLGDPISTGAILDRIFHHSVIVRIKGPSYRKHQGELLQEEYAEKKANPDDKGNG